MKATTEQLVELKLRIANALTEKPLTRAQIGQISRVHASQVSRICRGDFKTISHNVVQVCKVLGLEIETVAAGAKKEEEAWLKIEASAREIWDKSPESAEKIARILKTIGQLRV